MTNLIKKDFLRFLKKNGIYINFIAEFDRWNSKNFRLIFEIPIKFNEYVKRYWSKSKNELNQKIRRIIYRAFNLEKF